MIKIVFADAASRWRFARWMAVAASAALPTSPARSSTSTSPSVRTPLTLFRIERHLQDFTATNTARFCRLYRGRLERFLMEAEGLAAGQD